MKTAFQPSTRLREAFKGQSFISTADFDRPALAELLDLAMQHKYHRIDPGRPLEGKSVGLIFFNPSLRTRTSMTIAVHQLGGTPVTMDAGTETWVLEFEEGAVMNDTAAEHIQEAAPVLAQYLDAVGVRCFSGLEDLEEDRRESVLRAFQRHGGMPVINLESATQHPLQGLGDVLTIRERFGTVDQRKVTLAWAYHPKPLPAAVPNSFALAAAQYGMDLTLAHPPEFALDPVLMERVEELARLNQSRVRIVDDLAEGCRGAEVVYAKSWAAPSLYGRLDEEAQVRRRYRDWMISEPLMELTHGGVFMHCLPVRRNVVVTDEVLDGPRSIVIPQSSNRLHIQKTLLSLILGEG